MLWSLSDAAKEKTKKMFFQPDLAKLVAEQKRRASIPDICGLRLNHLRNASNNL
jgi:hypothetical protein